MTKPLIPWIGGKRRLAAHLIPMIADHKCYVEVCAGAAAILFMKEPSHAEVLNDVNGELINLYRVVQHHLEEFCRQFKHALVSRQMFEWEQMKVPATLTDIQRAARFFYLQKLAFGSKIENQAFGTFTSRKPGLNLLRIEEELSAAHMRLARCTIEQLDWKACVEKYDTPDTFFFLDPPYYETEGYGVEFGLEQYQEMARMARKVKGKMLITVGNHPAMRAAFKGLPIRRVSVQHTVGGRGGVPRHELIIRNRRRGFKSAVATARG